MDAHTWLLSNLTGGGGPAAMIGAWLLIAVGVLALLMFFRPALGLSRYIDKFNSWIGHSIAWMILVAVLVSAANAVVRKVFNTSSNAWLEIQWILFGAVFLLCSPWTLMANEHIRIDIVNSLLPKRLRDWIDVVGHWFFVVPICLVMLYTAVPFFWRSLMQNEQSTNAGGLPVYPSKFLIPLGIHAAPRAGPLGADQAPRDHEGHAPGYHLGRRSSRGGRSRGRAPGEGACRGGRGSRQGQGSGGRRR